MMLGLFCGFSSSRFPAAEPFLSLSPSKHVVIPGIREPRSLVPHVLEYLGLLSQEERPVLSLSDLIIREAASSQLHPDSWPKPAMWEARG